METNFKVLIYAQFYVDDVVLHKGIYRTSEPRLFGASETIESIIEFMKSSHRAFMNNSAINDKIENLKKKLNLFKQK